MTQVLRVDEKTRTIHFLGVGREKGRDPYFVHLYRVGFDGKNLQLLTPEDAMHDISLSPSGQVLHRQLFEARRAAPWRCCATRDRAS